MASYLTTGDAITTYQTIKNMNYYATNSKADSVYSNVLLLSGYLNTLNKNSLLNFQTIPSYYL